METLERGAGPNRVLPLQGEVAPKGSEGAQSAGPFQGEVAPKGSEGAQSTGPFQGEVAPKGSEGSKVPAPSRARWPRSDLAARTWPLPTDC